MARKPLTQTRIDSLRARTKPYKEFDGGGLHLLVTPNGSKLWRMAYRFGGKQKTLAFGVYDAETNGLTEARAKRETAKLTLKRGRDPSRITPHADGQSTFKQVALAWHTRSKSGWAPKYAALILSRLEDDIFPEFGSLPIGSVKSADVLAALQRVEDRGAIDTAHRLNQYVGAIFRFCDDDDVGDPTPKVRDRLQKRPKVKHYKSLKADQIGPFLANLEASECEPPTRYAMLLTIYTAARTANVIAARWDQFEHMRSPQKALWRIAADDMKKSREHLTPLSPQVLTLLAELHKITGRSEYLFPAADGRPGHMSNNTMLFHCYAMGYRNKTTMHGFRGSFSTIANESGLWNEDWIEMQLAHAEDDKVRAAYNSALYLPQRRQLMAWWADQLDAMRGGAHWQGNHAGAKIFG